MYESKRKYAYGTGRRKSSIARVRVYENGTGSIIINGRDIAPEFAGRFDMVSISLNAATAE